MMHPNISMAMFFYHLSCKEKFDQEPRDYIVVLSKEIQKLSLRLPFEFQPEEFAKGLWKKACEKEGLGFISATSDNYVRVKGKVKNVTPLYLFCLYQYCINRLSKGGYLETIDGRTGHQFKGLLAPMKAAHALVEKGGR